MSRLRWFRFDHGWRAGPYDIELAAPRLWVCTRRSDGVEIVATSGSLRALKRTVTRIEERRQNRRQSMGYLVAFVVFVMAVIMVALLDTPHARLLLLPLGGLALFTAWRAIDFLTDRPWESIRLTYQ